MEMLAGIIMIRNPLGCDGASRQYVGAGYAFEVGTNPIFDQVSDNAHYVYNCLRKYVFFLIAMRN